MANDTIADGPAGVLFDVDGTLVDTPCLHAVCWGEALRQDEHDVLRAVLDADDAITAATSSDDAEAGKPHPDILQAVMEGSGLVAQRVVFVGDSVWDGHAAQRVGVPFVGVTCGGTSEAELREVGAVEVWRDPAELLAQLAGSAVAALLG